MNKNDVRIADRTFTYYPNGRHKVWAYQSSNGDWRVCALFDETTQMRTSDTWPDVFIALQAAWRIAITVRAIEDRDDFIEVCQEIHEMQLERSNALHLPGEVRVLMQAGTKK